MQQKPLSRNASLSDLLYAERSLLRPVKFVPATHTPFLFQQSDDIFQPASECTGANTKSDAPTTDHVTRVFNNAQPLSLADSISEDEASDEIEEIDFADLSKLCAEDNTAVPKRSKSLKNAIVEETFTGVYNMQKPTGRHESNDDTQEKQIVNVKGISTTIIGRDRPLQALEQSIDALKVIRGRGVQTLSTMGVSSSQAGAESAEVAPALSALKSSPASHSCNSPPAAVAEKPSNPPESISSSPRPDPLENESLFVIDTQAADPFTSRSTSDEILFDRTGRGDALGEEEEVIVYVAPHPRTGRVPPPDTTPQVRLPTTSILIGTSESRCPSKEDGRVHPFVADQGAGPQLEAQPLSLSSLSFNFERAEPSIQPRQPPAFTPSQQKKAQFRAKRKETHVARRRKARRGFGSFGAMMSEAQLHDADERERRDPQWETRRKEDSDIDWGDDDDAVAARMESGGAGKAVNDVDELSSGLDGMDLDPDVGLDMRRMLDFVQSMSADGSRFVTMDDVEDKQRMREEDEKGAKGANVCVTPSSSDGDENEDNDNEDDDDDELAFQLEEEFMIAESEREIPSGRDSSDEKGSSDEELNTIKKRKDKMSYEGDEDVLFSHMPGDSDDEDILELEECSQFFSKRDWYDTFDHSDMLSSTRRKKGKGRPDYLPEDLKAQWERDRAKKAENKRLRKEARMLASLDPFSPKKGGKKARKLMMDIFNQLSQTANHSSGVVGMSSIETLMREFVANIGGRQSIALPPMNKGSRKIVHELAAAFNLASHSKGSGPGRYITLTKTTRSGIISEGKVKALMKRATRGSGREFERQDKGRPRMPAHREGDEVGKEAPVVGESNIGFKMLSSMGWSEGVKIGGESSIGIEVPLTAVIKKSRLGLGATSRT